MENLNNWIIATNDFIWTYILIALLICIGVYFTFKSKFVQFRNIREMFRLLGDGIASGNHKNSVSSFQAFCIATASRVGTGNLAGVATALALGGPGAIFWMWLIALIGSASAFIRYDIEHPLIGLRRYSVSTICESIVCLLFCCLSKYRNCL